MTSLGRRNARERIAALIVELTCRAQCTDLGKHEYSIDLPVTQMMIGDALGLSHEHVCRVLGKLANDGVIEINNHTLNVLDQVALARESGADTRDMVSRESLLLIAA
jgi:CRP/FNR family transcriptional regulator, anaerobic regulatory protein